MDTIKVEEANSSGTVLTNIPLFSPVDRGRAIQNWFKDEMYQDPYGNMKEYKEVETADDWMAVFCDHSESFPACITVSDCTLPDWPMVKFPSIYQTIIFSNQKAHVFKVFVNTQFLETTGYGRDEVIGRNCRFLQGIETEQDQVQILRDALANEKSCNVIVTNYRKNGEPFKNLLTLKPVRDGNDFSRFVIGVQFEVFDYGSELRERLKQLDDLLKKLPSKINLPSKKTLTKSPL